MPELLEYETTRRGIAPHTVGLEVTSCIIRNSNLRWPVQDDLPHQLTGQRLNEISRRGKYLLLHFANGTLLWHLGMSGNLRVIDAKKSPEKHDHVDLVFGSIALRFNDPRRFGSILWTTENPTEHTLINHLGPEPLTEQFNGE